MSYIFWYVLGSMRLTSLPIFAQLLTVGKKTQWYVVKCDLLSETTLHPALQPPESRKFHFARATKNHAQYFYIYIAVQVMVHMLIYIISDCTTSILHYSKIASWTGLLLHIYSKNASEALAIFSSVDSIFFLMNSLRILWTIMFGINKADSLLEVFETIN